MVHEQKGSRGSTAVECLVERTFGHIDAMHGVIAFGDAATARSVYADRMHLVNLGHGFSDRNSNRGDAALIQYLAGCKCQRTVLAEQVGELTLEFDQAYGKRPATRSSSATAR
jgi:hypothetical protein